MNNISKETYEAPTLVAHGTVEEMTLAQSAGKLLDSDQPQGNVPLLS